MARQVQIIKGTTEQNDAFTGAEGALTYDTETKSLRIHDGTTEGGFEIPSSAMGDYVIYWDSADATDHSHAKPGVSTPTDHGWYRYYKSGWVEQGGKFATMDTTSLTISLPIEMSSNVYSIIGTGNEYSNTSGHFTPKSGTTTSFTAGVGTNGGNGGWWEVKGYAA